MKVLSFFLGAGSSLIFALFGAMMFWTKIHWGIAPVDWGFILSIVGIGYLFLQLLQVITMKGGGIKAGVMDIILSSIPGIVLIMGMVTGHAYVQETILYGGFIFLDMVLLGMTLKVFQLTSDITSIG